MDGGPVNRRDREDREDREDRKDRKDRKDRGKVAVMVGIPRIMIEQEAGSTCGGQMSAWRAIPGFRRGQMK